MNERMMQVGRIMAVAPAVVSAAPSFAQAAAEKPACPATPAPLPPELAAFRTPTAVMATTGTDAPVITPGRTVALALKSASDVHFKVAPSKPGAPGSHGGIVTLNVAAPGTYRFALSAGAWLEVASGGALLRSVAHDHGPACSGVRKIVDFALASGSYDVELTDSRAASLTLLVARLP